MKDLILIGIQGSGKGTQAKILAEKQGYQIFETGGVLRKLSTEDSGLGRQVKEITTRGDLVSNELVMDIVQDFVQNLEGGNPVIFDGIPRSIEQRDSLEKLLEKIGREFQVLEITLEDEVAFDRLMKRAEIEGRADDNPESIKKRIQNFYDFTEPLLAKWRQEGRIVSINGDQSIEEVQAEILEKI